MEFVTNWGMQMISKYISNSEIFGILRKGCELKLPEEQLLLIGLPDTGELQISFRVVPDKDFESWTSMGVWPLGKH